MPDETRDKPNALPYVALVLACAIPGAGHAYLGRLKRGIIIFVTITALFWSGVAVGGVLTVDSHRERWWFVAQMFTGIHGLVGWQREKRAYAELRNVPGGSLDERLKNAGIALVAPADTVARAYSGVAGLLNLMCIFDALMLSVMGRAGESPPGRRNRAGGAGRT
ncbi:MAG: hypothetical protein J7M21_06295 [Planctomycetes bacterium]|nr:hypothetical protein [Planctomycetota bacterium]